MFTNQVPWKEVKQLFFTKRTRQIFTLVCFWDLDSFSGLAASGSAAGPALVAARWPWPGGFDGAAATPGDPSERFRGTARAQRLLLLPPAGHSSDSALSLLVSLQRTGKNPIKVTFRFCTDSFSAIVSATEAAASEQ